METKYKWNEKKSVDVLTGIVVLLMLYGLIIHPFIIFPIIYFGFYKLNAVYMFIPFIFSLPIVLILTTIGNHISDKDEFSQKFILDIKHKLNDATTLAELIEIRNEFESEAINKETNQFRLAYPNTLSNIHTELLNKIEILKKQKL